MSRQITAPFAVSRTAYRRQVKELVSTALAEDIGRGDLTTRALALGRRVAVAQVVARTSGTLAGAEAFTLSMRKCNPRIQIAWRHHDGQSFAGGDQIARVSGSAAAILTAERTALNFLGRLSGVASATRNYTVLIPKGTARLLDTRKTTPGWRLLEKYATAVGGAYNHRLGLDDALMIKDNHIIAAGGLANAVTQALPQARGRHLICEVTDILQIRTALGLGIRWLLLDNFRLAQLRQAVVEIRKYERTQRARVFVEASGGITRRNIAAIARTGVDFISVGAITHSATSIDFSLQFDPGAVPLRTKSKPARPV